MKTIYIYLLLLFPLNLQAEGTIYTVQGVTGFFSDPQLACETRLSGDSRNITNIVYDPNLTPYNCTYYVDNDPSFFTYNMTQTTCPSGTFASISTGTCLTECPFGDTPSNGVCATEQPITDPTCPTGYSWSSFLSVCVALNETDPDTCPDNYESFTNQIGLLECRVGEDATEPDEPEVPECTNNQYFDVFSFTCKNTEPQIDETPDPTETETITDDGDNTESPATDENQEQISDQVNETNELLRQIEDNTDNLENNTDGIEGLLQSNNKTLIDILRKDESIDLSGVENKLNNANAELREINNRLDTKDFDTPATPAYDDNTQLLIDKKAEYQQFLMDVETTTGFTSLSIASGSCVNPTLNIPGIGTLSIDICSYLNLIAALGYLIILMASWSAIQIIFD